jgi:hypothetical protein
MSEPTTPVRVPKAAGTYTRSTQDPELRSEINSILLKEGHASKYVHIVYHSSEPFTNPKIPFIKPQFLP